MGRWFSKEDDTPGSPETAISYAYWQRKFGGDCAVLGRTIAVDFVPRRVIGVMPRDFRFVNFSPRYPPAAALSQERVSPEEFTFYRHRQAQARRDDCVGEPGCARSGRHGGKRQGAGRMLEKLQITPNLRPLKKDVVGDVGSVLRVLMGALGLVLLLVCANVANLVQVRAQSRQQEFAIRAALGAGWGRIARRTAGGELAFGILGGAAWACSLPIWDSGCW